MARAPTSGRPSGPRAGNTSSGSSRRPLTRPGHCVPDRLSRTPAGLHASTDGHSALVRPRGILGRLCRTPLLAGDLGLASGAHDPLCCACGRRNVPLKCPRAKTTCLPRSASPGRRLFFGLKASVFCSVFLMSCGVFCTFSEGFSWSFQCLRRPQVPAGVPKQRKVQCTSWGGQLCLTHCVRSQEQRRSARRGWNPGWLLRGPQRERRVN